MTSPRPPSATFPADRSGLLGPQAFVLSRQFPRIFIILFLFLIWKGNEKWLVAGSWISSGGHVVWASRKRQPPAYSQPFPEFSSRRHESTPRANFLTREARAAGAGQSGDPEVPATP